MPIVFGGDKAWKVHSKGELVIAFHWVNGDPAMVLLPKRRPLGWGAFIIPIGVAHCWARRDGYPTPESIERAVTAAKVLGLEPQKDTVRGIVEAVLDYLPDLLAMPPEPPAAKERRAVVGEASLKMDGKVIAERDIEALPTSVYVPDNRLH